jgi:flagellar protein FliS
MAAAAHPYCAPCTPPSAPAAFCLLVDGALERIGLARGCLERGTDPGRHLRTAVLQVREVGASLESSCADAAMAANLADLSDYMCRQLAGVEDYAARTTLADVSDLLRELRCAYVSVPAVTRSPGAAAAAAARM